MTSSLGAILGPPCAIGSNPPRPTGLYASFEAWLGRPVGRLHSYLLSSPPSWAALAASAGAVVPNLAAGVADRAVAPGPLGSPRAGCGATLSVPLTVAGASLESVAGGAGDAVFGQIADELVAAGLGAATIRLGWEFNGNWYAWAAGKDPAGFAAAFRRAVAIFRGTLGSSFVVEWCPNAGPSSSDAAAAWPGGDVVDLIGIDAYDFGPPGSTPEARWNKLLTEARGLDWVARFAASNGKRLAVGEWGTSDKAFGDDPFYFREMAAWIASENVAEHFLFAVGPEGESGTSHFNLSLFPNSAFAYRAAFGTVEAANAGLAFPQSLVEFG
jgi:hypothetical protein